MNELPKEVRAGDEIEVQLAPLGDYPCRDGEPGHDLVQRVTPEAVSRLAHSFSHEILIDLDHASETSAAANADKCAPAALKNAYLRDPALAAEIVKNIKAAPRAPEQKLLDALDAGLTPDSARALAAKLADTLPNDPEMAATLAEEMAKAVNEELDADAAENRQGERCPECEQWLDANGVCHHCHGADEAEKEGNNPESAETQAAEIGKGKAAVKKCLETKADVYDAVSRGDVGIIGIVYGDRKAGVAHFMERTDTLQHLPETLVRGKAGKPYQDGQKLNIVNGKYTAVLALTGRAGGDKPPRWVLTSFQSADQKHERA